MMSYLIMTEEPDACCGALSVTSGVETLIEHDFFFQILPGYFGWILGPVL
jgi:hypothetical protein